MPALRRAIVVAAAAGALALPALAATPLPPLEHNGVTADAWTTVDAQPGNPAVGFGSVWVPSSGSGKLDRVDPTTLEVTRIASTHVAKPAQNQYFDSVAISKNAVWHASDLGNSVSHIDPSTNKVVAKIPLPWRPDEIAAGPGGVYVGLFNTNTVIRIDPATNKIARKRNLSGSVLGMAVAGGKLWALYGTTVAQLDPKTLALRTRFSVKSSKPFSGGFAPAWWLAGDAKTLCVGNLQQNAVTIADPATGKVSAQVVLPFGSKPFSVAAASGKCWASNDSGVFLVGADGAVAYSHLPALGTSTFTGVAPGWVTLAGSNKLLRIAAG